MKTTTKRIPRLDATALRTITKTMKSDKQFRDMIQGSPSMKDLLLTIQKNVKLTDIGRLSENKQQLKFIFTRFIHLNLVHSLLVLFSHEPDCLVALHFPRRHLRVEIFTDRDERNRPFYLVDVYKNDDILRQLSFWDKDGFVSYLIGFFMENLPKEVSVFRSSISMTASRVHSFIRAVREMFGETKVPQKIVRIYNQRKQNKQT